MKKPDITIFFNPSCPYCHKALEFLAAQFPDATLDAINLGDDYLKDKKRFSTELKKCGLESRGIPLIITDGECFQGFDEKIADAMRRRINSKVN